MSTMQLHVLRPASFCISRSSSFTAMEPQPSLSVSLRRYGFRNLTSFHSQIFLNRRFRSNSTLQHVRGCVLKHSQKENRKDDKKMEEPCAVLTCRKLSGASSICDSFADADLLHVLLQQDDDWRCKMMIGDARC
ncbi:unnamed protein product [Vicia faba]|uniref:Uncharacterized protein n=1 Tax=Vicia faba TaxID=3906 RepID=A0AAV1ARU9_VICFA|nr:unnamed protein product [Vicia faba]